MLFQFFLSMIPEFESAGSSCQRAFDFERLLQNIYLLKMKLYRQEELALEFVSDVVHYLVNKTGKT